MTTDDIADVLEEISAHLELDGKDQEAIAYSKASDTVRERDFIPADPSMLDGVGEKIRENILEHMQRGEVEKLQQLKEKYPYLEELRQVEGIGPTTAQRIHETLGISHIGELKERSDELPQVHRIGEKTADNIVAGVDDYINGVTERKPFDKADRVMGRVLKIFERELGTETDAEGKTYLPITVAPAGSFRRFSETIGDLDVLVVRDHPKNPVPIEATPSTEEIWDAIEEYADRILNRGDTKCTAIIDGLHVDFRLVPHESFGAAMQYFTGSKSHNIKLRSHAVEKGWKLNEYGLFNEDGNKIAGETEREIYEELGVPFVKPENRDGQHIESA